MSRKKFQKNLICSIFCFTNAYTYHTYITHVCTQSTSKSLRENKYTSLFWYKKMKVKHSFFKYTFSINFLKTAHIAMKHSLSTLNQKIYFILSKIQILSSLVIILPSADNYQIFSYLLNMYLLVKAF